MHINLRLDSRCYTGRGSKAGVCCCCCCGCCCCFSGHRARSQPHSTWSGIASALVTSDTQKWHQKKCFPSRFSPIWQPDSWHRPSWPATQLARMKLLAFVKVIISSRQCAKHYTFVTSMRTLSQCVWLTYTVLKILPEGFWYQSFIVVCSYNIGADIKDTQVVLILNSLILDFLAYQIMVSWWCFHTQRFLFLALTTSPPSVVLTKACKFTKTGFTYESGTTEAEIRTEWVHLSSHMFSTTFSNMACHLITSDRTTSHQYLILH